MQVRDRPGRGLLRRDLLDQVEAALAVHPDDPDRLVDVVVGREGEGSERGLFLDVRQRAGKQFAVGFGVGIGQIDIVEGFGQQLDPGVGLGGELVGILSVGGPVVLDELLVFL